MSRSMRFDADERDAVMEAERDAQTIVARTEIGRAPNVGGVGRRPCGTRLRAFHSARKRTSRTASPGRWRSRREFTDRRHRMVSEVRPRLRHGLFAGSVFGPARESPLRAPRRAKATAELLCLHLFLFRVRGM